MGLKIKCMLPPAGVAVGVGTSKAVEAQPPEPHPSDMNTRGTGPEKAQTVLFSLPSS